MFKKRTDEPIVRNAREGVWLTGRYVLMIALLLVFVGPFLWLLSISFRGSESVYSFNLIPKHPTLQNFVDTWNIFGLARAFANSVWVAVVTVALNVLFCSMAAYPLARIKFPGSQVVFFIILSTLMIPFQLNMIPLYLICLKLGLVEHFPLLTVILPGTVGAFGIYLIKQYYQTIPKDLEEAARIDGAGEFSIWWRIMFPLTKPAVAALGIFVFVANWSSFLWPLIVLNKKETLPIAVARLSGAFVDKTQYIAAGSVIAILPVIVFFFFLQRYFIGGLTLGSVKA